jgi:ATP-binding cassette, subfamily B (MDR/TAP), member 1
MAASDFERLSTLPETSDELRGELRFPISGQVSFHNVTFAYPTRPDVPILRGVTLQLQPGECVAIVGPSGSGKSTIAALLQRLYEPSSGDITLDRYKLAQADVRWLRDHVSIVSQNANLFDGTVEENIAYGSGQVPIGEVERAAKAANVHDFIMSLPDRYQTNLGENASLISGGQAQRLQIARALVKRSSILILDECTSALDLENQQAVLETIMEVKQTRTTIFVTHKADVMRKCDRVLCMADGVIAEEGRYDELVARRGVFAKLMQSGEWQ